VRAPRALHRDGLRVRVRQRDLTTSGTQYCVSYDNGQCAGGSGLRGGEGCGGSASSPGWWCCDLRRAWSGGGTVSSPAPAPKPIEGVKCLPVPPRKESYCDKCALTKANRKDIVQAVAPR